jgi:glycosyltransferase involved in cell wall biosynthesis
MSKRHLEGRSTYRASGESLTIIYFAKSTSIGPTSRYRIFQFLPVFEEQGIECTVRPLFEKTYWRIIEIPSPFLRVMAKMVYVTGRFLRRAWDVLTIGDVDLVVIEGQLFPYMPALAERMLARLHYRFIIEFDDAIYLTPGHRQKIPALLGMASGAIVGNEVLAKYARKYTSQVYVIPTVVDTQRFAPRQTRVQWIGARTETPITVVWIGLAYNLGYLDIVAPVLKELQDKGLIKFRVVCSQPPRLPGLTVEFRPWQLEQEVELLQDCHIGIMPLPDTEWARGKCALKLLQYMSVGMAAVASPVGVNREIISDGETGYFAVTEQDWRDRLTRLCQDAVLREEMGRAARTAVGERYSLNAWGPRLAKQYQEIANEARSVRVVDSRPRSLTRYH